jgi:polyvinyl alcohol dehydrogenase (cytochrome)
VNVLTTLRAAAVLVFATLMAPAIAQAQSLDASLPGKAVFDGTCATCHTAPAEVRVPTMSALAAMPAAQIRDAMNDDGKMAEIAAGLSTAQRAQVVAYLTSAQTAAAARWADTLMCAADKRTVDVNQPVVSSGFSVDRNQTRSLTAAQAGLRAADMKNLEMAWAIGFSGQSSGTGASIVGTTMFVTMGGRLLALDTASGCAKWSIANASRNTPAFGDIGGRKVIALAAGRDVLVVDAKNGETVWQASGQADGNSANIRGGVVFYRDKIIVPLSASGVATGAQAAFECCIGHGAVVALSAKDGTKLWEYQTMPAATYNGETSSTGVKQRGPSGAPIWAIPLVDEARNRVIVATGENTSHPATSTSDAVIALDLDTGREVWKFQAMALDVWNEGCTSNKASSGPNCPWNVGADAGAGRDFDFGAGVTLAKGAGGKDVVLAGQKSGDVWALDAATGVKLWNVKFGDGTALGGIHWGITTDGERVFAAVNDPLAGGTRTDPVAPGSTSKPRPGVFAVDIKTGKQVWGYDAKPHCDGERATLVTGCTAKYGFSAAPLTVDGAVVAGTLGGEVVIFDGKTGQVLNTLDTVGPKATVNGVAAHGGSIDAHGISAGAGMIFINSGYGSFGQTMGNVLIAYRPKK